MSLFREWLLSLRLYVRIVLFISSPADLPYSPSSVVLTLVAYLATAVYLLGDNYDLPSIITLIGVEGGILYLVSYLMLKTRGMSDRLMQTLSALFGSGLIISLIGIPLLMAVPVSSGDNPNLLAQNLNLALLLWSLMVISLIFKRAFDVSTILAGFLAFNYFFIYELIIINVLK